MEARIVAAVVIAACSSPASPPPQTIPTPPPVVEDPRLAELAAAAFARDLAPGMAVVVVRDGVVVLARGYGFADVEAKRPVTADTAFYIASTTKSFVGLAAAALAARGAVSLDASLVQLLPDAKLHAGLDPAAITLRALLSHTHGIDSDGPITLRTAFAGDVSDREIRALLVEHGPAKHGREFEYGNLGYVLAGSALGSAQRTTWQGVVEREVFAPLGMQATTGQVSRVSPDRLAQPYRAEPSGFVRMRYGKTDRNMHAAGGLISTPRDLGRWLLAHLQYGMLDGVQAVPAAAFREVHRSQTPAQGTPRFGWTAVGYGLGWEHVDAFGEQLLAHGGEFPGFAAHISMIPARGLGVAVLANDSLFGSVLVQLVADEMYSSLLGKPPGMRAVDTLIERMREAVAKDRERRASRVQTLAHPLSAYVGTFEHPTLGRLELAIVEDRLEARYGVTVSSVEVYDHEKDILRAELAGGGSTLAVAIRDGRAAHIEWMGRTFVRAR